MIVKSKCLLAIELTAVLAFSLSVADAAALASLPRTGQTTCWDANGSPVACAGTGQDGDKQAGVPMPSSRFNNNGNGTITDKMTGLVWLKNANCFGYKPWTTALNKANTLSNGTCSLADGSKAGDWRLPNRKEMLSLLNRQQGDSIIYLGEYGFSAIQQPTAGVLYWTSTTSAENDSRAWSVNFSDSSINYSEKDYVGYIWPVRNSQ